MDVKDLLQKTVKKKGEERGKLEQPDKPLSEDEKEEVNKLIEQNKVVVFSKSYCPFCRQAKMAFKSIAGLDYEVVELDDGNHDGWQSYIAEIAKTKAIASAANNNTKSVPQIFINQSYIGGADDLAELFASKKLSEMLGCAI